MERIRNLVADLAQYLSAASPREKRLMTFAVAGVAIFAGLITWAGFSGAIRRRNAALEEKRDDFEKVERLAANYGAQEMERQSLEQRLRQSPGQLMSYVDGLARQEQIDIGSMTDRGVVAGGQGGRPRESQVEVNLGKVPLDKLMRLLEAIEQNPGVVRVRRLRLRKSYDNKETLDASISISTWTAS